MRAEGGGPQGLQEYLQFTYLSLPGFHLRPEGPHP
jgi:hypothetical protein